MKMTRAALLASAIILWAGPCVAQVSCEQIRIAMTQFRQAEFSAPIIWKAATGERAIENLSEGVMLDDHSVIAGGYYALADQPDQTQSYLMRMERRGKVIWQVRGEAKTVQKIIRIAKDGENIVTLSTLTPEETAPRRIDVAQYDLDGKRLGGFSVNEGDGNLDPVSIVAVKDGYYIAARYANRKVANQKFGVVYKMDKTGKRLWRRAYIPGLTTDLMDMIVLKNGDVLMSGSLTEKDGRKSGWIVRTDSAGGMKWQKNYLRGRAAELSALAEATDGSGYIATGTSWPITGERTGAWVMKIDSGGAMVWERFYSGVDDYRGADITALDDGRTIVMIPSLPVGGIKDGHYAHARLVTLSPRGDLMEADSFTDGNGLWPSRLLNAGAQPLLIGTIREIPPEPALDKDKKPLPPPPESYDGWVAELQTLSSYDDPCVSQ